MKLPGYLLLFPLLSSATASSIKQNETAATLEISTPLYTAIFQKNEGYRLAALKDQASGQEISFQRSGVNIMEEGEYREFMNRWFGTPRIHQQKEATATASFDPSDATLTLQWESPAGKATQRYRFTTESRQIAAELTFESALPIVELSYLLDSRDFGTTNADRSVLYPDGTDWSGTSNIGFGHPIPEGKFIWNERRKVGFGLGANESDGVASIETVLRGPRDGANYRTGRLTLASKTTRWNPVPSTTKMSFTIQAGGTPEEAAEFAQAMTGDAPPVKLIALRPAKSVYAPGEDAVTEIVIRNRSSSRQDVELVHELETGIDEIRALGRQKAALSAMEQVTLEAPWNAGNREHGATFRTRVLLNGKEIDRLEEVTSINRFHPQPGQLAILNPAGATERSEQGAVELLRQNYISVLEYYCWMPDQIFDLTPDTEQWHPHTESQRAYEGTLTQNYLKTLSKYSDDHGIGLYAMLSGFASLPYIYRHPEALRYTADGQPYLYNGGIHGENRYAVGPVNFFDEEFVRRWAEEMVASIEQFGWKGCRWDCNFLPNVPSDPLGLDSGSAVAEAHREESRWYNYKGEPSDQLFPEPDKTGTMLLKTWRSVVAEKYPDFVYGTNQNGSEENVRAIPDYFKESTTHSLILFEYLLNPNKEDYNTWDKWAKHLSEAALRVRANGGQPAVGYMRGFLPGGISMRLSQHLVFASGVHWGAYVRSGRHMLDDTWKQFRFAMRFSEYFYDPAFVRPPEPELAGYELQGSERILWQPFIYQRPSASGRDIVIHLLNRPKQDWIVVHHEEPEPRENFVITLPLQPGERVHKTALLLPEPYPIAQPIVAKSASGKATITVPRLDLAATLYLEVSK